MKLAVVLPAFQVSADPARRALDAAVEADLDGCFVYDHLWPLGAPGRPALAPVPLLASLASRSGSLVLGTLVARVGLVPNRTLEAALLSLQALLGERFIAGIGAGDHKSAVENLAYGVPLTPAAARRAEMVDLGERLMRRGVRTWIGGGSTRTNEAALGSGAVLNLWSAPIELVATLAGRGEVTWGGTLPNEPEVAACLLRDLADAGASWAVFAWPGSVTAILDAARAAELSRT